MPTPSIDQLKRAIALAEQIQQLKAELAGIVGDSSSVTSAPKAVAFPTKKTGKRTMSPVTIAKMKAAQQARWAKKKGEAVISAVETAVQTAVKSTEKIAKKAKRKLSPEGRARIVAALKARWAAKKKAQK
jgi:hypothetical protein